jgi:iron-sulfur cluster assembly accessory protein
MIHLSPSAAKEIKRQLAKQQNPSVFFRLQVKAGGCSGRFYNLGFDEVARQGDQVFSCADISVILDAESLDYVKDLTLDYSEDLMGGGFRFHNPQALSSCGCGNSFSVNADS